MAAKAWLLTGLVAVGCALNPVSRRPEVVLVSSAQEREIGREEAQKVEQGMGLVDDAALQAYVQSIGERLAQHSPRQDVEYHFQVVDMREPNAFALPGGYVYVSRGLLALVNQEDELANVIGHEIGHVAARHAVRRLTVATPFAVVTGIPALLTGIVSPTLGGAIAGVGNLAGGLVLAPYSRGQERDADRIGIELAARAGWDPEAMSRFLHTLERDETLAGGKPRRASWLDSHPATPERVRDTREQARQLSPAPRAAIAGTRPELLARLDGLLVGENPSQGVFLEERFLQPELDFTLRFPSEWQTQNAPEVVAAVAPSGDTFLALHVIGEGADPVEGARSEGLDEALQEQLEPLEIGGLPAARLVTQRRGKGLDLTWIAHRGLVYRITGASPAHSFEAVRDTFRAAALSFRPLRPGDRAGILESRLRTRRARDGEGLEDLLARTGGTWSAAQMAVANGLEQDARLGSGQLVKVPVPQPYVASGP